MPFFVRLYLPIFFHQLKYQYLLIKFKKKTFYEGLKLETENDTHKFYVFRTDSEATTEK